MIVDSPWIGGPDLHYTGMNVFRNRTTVNGEIEEDTEEEEEETIGRTGVE